MSSLAAACHKAIKHNQAGSTSGCCSWERLPVISKCPFTHQLTLHSFHEALLFSFLTLFTRGFLSGFDECPFSLDSSHSFTWIWTNVIFLLIPCSKRWWEFWFPFKILKVSDHKFTGAMQIVCWRAAASSSNTTAVLCFEEQLVLSACLPFAPSLPSVVLQFSANSDDLSPCFCY